MVYSVVMHSVVKGCVWLVMYLRASWFPLVLVEHVWFTLPNYFSEQYSLFLQPSVSHFPRRGLEPTVVISVLRFPVRHEWRNFRCIWNNQDTCL